MSIIPTINIAHDTTTDDLAWLHWYSLFCSRSTKIRRLWWNVLRTTSHNESLLLITIFVYYCHETCSTNQKKSNQTIVSTFLYTFTDHFSLLQFDTQHFKSIASYPFIWTFELNYFFINPLDYLDFDTHIAGSTSFAVLLQSLNETLLRIIGRRPSLSVIFILFSFRFCET